MIYTFHVIIEMLINDCENLYMVLMVTKNKILIAYFTKGGASEEYAKIISETLKEKNYSVDIHNLAQETPDISEYDTIILGTGVRMFRVYRQWKKILKQKELEKKHLFIFLASGMATEEPEKAVEKFLKPIVKKYDLKPVSLISFPGKIPEKWVKEGDEKETMKPDVAIAWAEEISQHVQNHR